ncbi:entry exclusion lipoprotein TrbK [Marinomonas atlantica]|uniref:entry exclusion lipoprotein TrbK n=1 Tax=Marinomonas atlantica TaxID=1806668 RepID=UPI00082B3040|nr:entry exclusion lipoprotein TrbK [Marinomonas atlantica]
MNTIKSKYIIGLMAVAAFTTACSEKIPTVNQENCTKANIQQIEDSKVREDFSDQCFDFRIEQGKEKASSLLEQGKDKTEELYDDSADAMEDAYDSTTDAMEDGAEAVGDAWDESVDAVENSADEVADEIDDSTK